MSYSWFDLVGNIGSALIISTYFLLQVGLIGAKNLWYSLLNFTGAIAITISLIYEFNLSAFIIEVFWILISLVGIFRYLIENNHQDKSTNH